MKIIKYQEQELKENPHKVDVRQLYDKESAQAMHMTLQPGEGLIPHITPVDVFFYILEGKPTIWVGEEKQQCYKDTLVESPAGIAHNITNDSAETARILVVKAPRPTQKTKLL
ncbi:MAG: cupin domain-containing protein [Chlorobi bacterium]|nr:cupin domain-containing protein [Chlorobiota bacterium]